MTWSFKEGYKFRLHKRSLNDLSYLIALLIFLFLDKLTSGLHELVGIGSDQFIIPMINFEFFVEVLYTFFVIISLISLLVLRQKYPEPLFLLTCSLATLGLIINVIAVVGCIILIPSSRAPWMMLDAFYTFISTILVFLVWYWWLDHRERKRKEEGHSYKQVLVFPQDSTSYHGHDSWKPGFVDYFYLSFNTSSTFGPTDTLILTRPAKAIMIIQVAISLVILLVLAARAIGIVS